MKNQCHLRCGSNLLRIVGVVGHCWGLWSVHLPASMVGPEHQFLKPIQLLVKDKVLFRTTLPASRVVVGIIGDCPCGSNAPKSLWRSGIKWENGRWKEVCEYETDLSNQKLHSVGMLKSNSRTERSVKKEICLPTGFKFSTITSQKPLQVPARASSRGSILPS